MYKRIVNLTAGAILFGYASSSLSAVLQDIKFSELPGEKAQIKLTFDEPPLKPQSYAIDQPARVVIDFPDVSSALAQKKYSVSVGDVDSAVALEAGGRTRLILNLSNSTPFNAVAAGNTYIIEVGSGGSSGNSISSSVASTSAASAPTSSPATSAPSLAVRSGVPNISGIDFRRGEKDEGKVIIDLTDPRVKVDVQEVSGGIDIKFINTFLPNQLRRKLDVVDFATPVNLVGASYQTDGTTISVKTRGEYDYLAYQADNQYVLSVKPLTPKQVADKKAKFAYTGEKLSLSFQDIDVRSVLQIIADFNNLNLVASDTVTGNITLRLDNVPWDQALDLVLKTKGLDKRQVGTVLMVAPAAEIAERERQEIETKKQLQELAPLRTEYIRVKYANARELFNLFINEQGQQGGAGGGGGSGGGAAAGGANGDQRNSTGSILSERGQAIVDERTNSIILTDTDEKIAEFKSLVDQIDIPIRQVMIEARIVIASNDFSKELGSRIYTLGQDNLTGAGTPTSVGRIGGRLEAFTSNDGGQGGQGNQVNLEDVTAVDLGVFDPAGALTYTLINSKIELGLEISALEQAGYGEVVSQPKVITGDKQKATISSGTEIGFQSESASGGTTVAFKEAALKLDVVPQITPDNRIIMDLIIEQNSVGEIVAGIPTLDITELTTQVLVNDGETVVLGGVYTTNTLKQETKIPFLGDIPYLGRLFRKNTQQDNKSEILIFVTPRIMSEKIRN